MCGAKLSSSKKAGPALDIAAFWSSLGNRKRNSTQRADVKVEPPMEGAHALSKESARLWTVCFRDGHS